MRSARGLHVRTKHGRRRGSGPGTGGPARTAQPAAAQPAPSRQPAAAQPEHLRPPTSPPPCTSAPRRARVLPGVALVLLNHAGRARLGRLVVHAVELDLIPLLRWWRWSTSGGCMSGCRRMQLRLPVQPAGPPKPPPTRGCTASSSHLKLEAEAGSARTWVAHLIQAGMRSTHSPYAVSSRIFTLVLRGG